MTKQETYKYLTEKGINYEKTEHKAVFSMDELNDVELSYPEANAKNIFIRDDKKKQYYLITIKGNKRVNLKEFKKVYGTRPLSFASSEDLISILKLKPGSVTPLGLLNDEERKVVFYLDSEFLEEPFLIGCHPNDNTATIWLDTKDLIKLIKDHGNTVEIIKF